MILSQKGKSHLRMFFIFIRKYASVNNSSYLVKKGIYVTLTLEKENNN